MSAMRLRAPGVVGPLSDKSVIAHTDDPDSDTVRERIISAIEPFDETLETEEPRHRREVDATELRPEHCRRPGDATGLEQRANLSGR